MFSMPIFWLARMVDHPGSCFSLNSGTNHIIDIIELKNQKSLSAALYRMTTNIPVSSYQHWVIELLYISTMIWTTWSNLELVTLRLDPNLQINYHVNKNVQLHPDLYIVHFLFRNTGRCLICESDSRVIVHHPQSHKYYTGNFIHPFLMPVHLGADTEQLDFDVIYSSEGGGWGVCGMLHIFMQTFYLFPLFGFKCCDMAVHIAKTHTLLFN
jgi:hypothetical protein